MKMRKIFIASVLAVFALGAGCKKKVNSVSTLVTASYPTVTIIGTKYVSIPVGGAFTPPDATAYDSFYKEKATVVKDLGKLDNTIPGLYTVTYSAKNTRGFVGTTNLYVAVTSVSDTLDISGLYYRDADISRPAVVTKLARGLFMTNNVGGVRPYDATTGAMVSAVFAVPTLSTLTFGSQLTSEGTLTSNSESLSLAVADTTLMYAISLPGFGTQVRTFKKQ
jgi:hypothetical protein